MTRLLLLLVILSVFLTSFSFSDAVPDKRKPTRTPKPRITATQLPTQAPTRMPTSRPSVIPSLTSSVTPRPRPTATATATIVPTTTPVRRQILWGAYIEGSPWNMAQQDNFENIVGKKATHIHLGISWYTWFGNTNGYLPTTTLEAIRERGALPVVSWFSAGRGAGNTNASIINGTHDVYLHSFAKSAATWGQPFVLRFDSEMNGNWWGYSEGINGNAVGSFVPMWRHVHDIFQSEGAANVIWAWVPNTRGPYGDYPLATDYPGTQYVNWVGTDGYNFNWNGDWQSFDQVFGATYNEIQTLAPGVPFMVGEFASNEAGDGGTKKAAWITDALEVQIPTRYPNIISVNWFNINDGVTWPLLSSAGAIQAFKHGISLSIYQ